ncbi:MAG TPA: ferrochelatase [Bacteroidia bacterium]|jgi:ferrochelatase|nr:ferrochelatase [Bacteroidia bacterium]
MSKTAVLLINLGTPDNPSTPAVRKYLTEFLNDRRVIDISAIGRFFLVNFLIVPFRASKSSKLYKRIWSDKGSPLLYNSLELKKKLQARLGNDFFVELAMRYQSPYIKTALENIRKQKPRKIVVMPLYPQYASSSTGSTIEKVFTEIKSWEVIPEMHINSNFHDNEAIINCYAEEAKRFNINEYDHVLFSYHGLPERQIKKASAHYGDNSCFMGKCCEVIIEKNQYCYRANCFKTTQLIAKKLNLPEEKYTICFQSRLGRSEWIKPYTDHVLKQRASLGNKKLLVLSPAFVADCLETIHEIGTEYNEAFKSYGGEKADLVPSLNSNDNWVEALSELIKGN